MSAAKWMYTPDDASSFFACIAHRLGGMPSDQRARICDALGLATDHPLRSNDVAYDGATPSLEAMEAVVGMPIVNSSSIPRR
jgi:hypothetical protein